MKADARRSLRRFGLSGVLVWLALLAACAPAAPPSTAKPAAGAPSGQAPAAASGQPTAPEQVVRGGTFVIGMHGDLVNFDAVTQTGALHLSVMGLVQSGLLKWG